MDGTTCWPSSWYDQWPRHWEFAPILYIRIDRYRPGGICTSISGQRSNVKLNVLRKKTHVLHKRCSRTYIQVNYIFAQVFPNDDWSVNAGNRIVVLCQCWCSYFWDIAIIATPYVHLLALSLSKFICSHLNLMFVPFLRISIPFCYYCYYCYTYYSLCHTWLFTHCLNGHWLRVEWWS